jgi:hypothetical protein
MWGGRKWWKGGKETKGVEGEEKAVYARSYD